MQTIEQFRAEQKAAAEKAEAAHIAMLQRAEAMAAAGLPVPEYISDGTLYGSVSVTYRNGREYAKEGEAKPRSMGEAVELFARFVAAGVVIPHHVLKDGSTCSLFPESAMAAYNERRNKHRAQNRPREHTRDSYKGASYAVHLDVRYMLEMHSTTARLEFFAKIGAQLYGVSIEFGRGYIGRCDSLAPSRREERAYGNRLVARSFTPNAKAYALADGVVTFGYGGDVGAMKTGADHRFLFVSDQDGEDPDECTHALEQLRTLAAQVDGVAQ